MVFPGTISTAAISLKATAPGLSRTAGDPTSRRTGFFYVSYEELSIYELSSTVAGAGSELSYDKAYVLDPMGINSSFVSNQDTATYWAANVFSKEAGTELLTSVNLFLWGSTSYEIYVTDGSLSLSG